MRICGFLTCVCLQVYSSASPLRLGPQRVGLAFASDAASGCKPEFSQGTGELSDFGQDHPGAKKPTQPKQAQPLIVEVNVGGSPILSPTESPDTLTSETVVVSSPAPDQEEDINAMDFATLQNRQVVALENVQTLTTQLARARDFASRITKRLKTMQECQDSPTPPANPAEDIEMEGMD